MPLQFLKNRILQNIFSIVIFISIAFIGRHHLIEGYLRFTPYISFSYEKDKALVLPYFDAAFYARTYADDLMKTGQAPIDHFMQHSFQWGGGEYDPNDWFNGTLYKERLWPCKGNPFVDFLRQPQLKISVDAPTVEIYANNTQLKRAWMAVEGFMRMNKFHVTLVLPTTYKNNIPVCFKPIMDRGLTVQISNDPKLSFYHSPFLKNPEQYHVSKLQAGESDKTNAISHVKEYPNFHYLIHRLYKCTAWKKVGLINPCMLNFAHNHKEPLMFSPFGEDEVTFKKNVARIADGFDLMLLNTDIGTPNLRILPGYLYPDVTEAEIPREKKYEISFLLSLGGKGMSSFKTDGTFIYHYRKVIWDRQDELPLPKKFYISKRNIDKFSRTLKDRVMPSESKKWIYGSQFTIAIENTKQAHYFSEKLLGAFVALNIPIYIGCPNIDKYFDTRGMFIAKDPDDVIRIVKSITPKTYQKMLPYLKENKRRAEKYFKLEQNYIDAFYREFIHGT